MAVDADTMEIRADNTNEKCESCARQKTHLGHQSIAALGSYMRGSWPNVRCLSRHCARAPSAVSPGRQQPRSRRRPLQSITTVTQATAFSCLFTTIWDKVSSIFNHKDMLIRSSAAGFKDLCWRSQCGQSIFKTAFTARCNALSKRDFSVSRSRWIKTADMRDSDLAAVKVDGRRLMDTLHHTCKFGTGLRWGR